MREIKFRAMRDDHADVSFVYGSLIYDKEGNPRIQINKESVLFVTCFKETEGQYTGLKDKNDVDIYEDDIVENCALIDYVVLDKGTFTTSRSKADKFGVKQPLSVHKGLEVIGNIIENPNLLEKVKA